MDASPHSLRVESARSTSDASLQDAVATFQAARADEARKSFHRVMRQGAKLVTLGILLYVGGFLARRASYLMGRCIESGGIVLLCGGLVLTSTCPWEQTDVEQMFAENWRTRCGLGLALALNTIVKGPIKRSAGVVCGLALVARSKQLPSWAYAPTTAVRCWMVSDVANDSLEMLLWWDTSLPPISVTVLTATHVSMTVLTVLNQLRLQCSSKNGSIVMFQGMYAYFLMFSIYHAVSAACTIGHEPFLTVILSPVLRVFAWGTATGAVILIGRKRLFQVSAERFDRDPQRAGKDAAFIAELLDSKVVELGQTWWLHRAEPDQRFAEGDLRRRWEEALVVCVHEEVFDVKVLSEAPAAPSRRSSFLRGSRMSKASADGEIKTVPLAAQGLPWDELLAAARQDLRCLEWLNMTEELMTGAICGSSDSALKQNTWYDLSRPVPEGEWIDMFLSHSWHDDKDQKWLELQRLGQEFSQRHGRYPCLWLDKVCIDQHRISDGLRVLPVNIMACRRMVVLLGETYISRLWCVWELFTLLAFRRSEQAAERLHFRVLASGAEELAFFDVRNAHCYDPNEEHRLMRIIRSLGEDRFNERVRTLSEVLIKKDKKPSTFKLASTRSLTRSLAISRSFLRGTSKGHLQEDNHSSSRSADQAKEAGGVREAVVDLVPEASNWFADHYARTEVALYDDAQSAANCRRGLMDNHFFPETAVHL